MFPYALFVLGSVNFRFGTISVRSIWLTFSHCISFAQFFFFVLFHCLCFCRYCLTLLTTLHAFYNKGYQLIPEKKIYTSDDAWMSTLSYARCCCSCIGLLASNMHTQIRMMRIYIVLFSLREKESRNSSQFSIQITRIIRTKGHAH